MRPQQLQNQNWKQIRRAAIPFGFRWMFKPVGFPNEAGLPERYTLIEIPDPLLTAFGRLAAICFALGIIGISGWQFLLIASLLIFCFLQLVIEWQIEVCQNAEEHLRQSAASKIITSKCD